VVATVPEPRAQDDVALLEQVNWTFSIGCQTIATETRTITYDPAQGVRISRDPLGEDGGVNLCGFVANKPVNLVDPSGLKQLDVLFGAFIPARVGKAVSEFWGDEYSNVGGSWFFEPGSLGTIRFLIMNQSCYRRGHIAFRQNILDQASEV